MFSERREGQAECQKECFIGLLCDTTAYSVRVRTGEEVIETRFDHVGLNAADLVTSIAFLHDMFGFDVIQRWDDPRQAFVGKGSVVLGMIEKKDCDFSRHAKAHIAFSCSQSTFPLVVAKVKDLGAEIVSGPKTQRDGETILFRDPSGNIFEVCYPSFR